MLKKLPLPVTGVALGMAALGNLLESYSAGVRYAISRTPVAVS